MTIEKILRKYGLPRPMIVRHDDPSGWMVPLAIEAQDICEAADARFVFLESREMQAVAVQDQEDVVGVYAGMFWMLCRLASLVAASGVFPTLKGIAEPTWTPDIKRSLRTPRDLLNEREPFDWQLESIGWKDAGERQILFYVVLSLCFRFVVFHEVGHIVNDHGRRRARAGSDLLLIDRPAPQLLHPEEAVQSQARELIADGFAFQNTIRAFDNELTNGIHLELPRIVRERLVPDTPGLIGFTLSVIFLYFRLSDRSDWHNIAIDRLSHPPAPFRMKALFALLLEAKPLGVNETMVAKIISETMSRGDAIVSVMFDIFPQPEWIKRISTPENDCHFDRIYHHFGNWSGRLPNI